MWNHLGSLGIVLQRYFDYVDILYLQYYLPITKLFYNLFLVYCCELAPGTVSLTGDRDQGDDSKHDSHYNSLFLEWCMHFITSKMLYVQPNHKENS